MNRLRTAGLSAFAAIGLGMISLNVAADATEEMDHSQMDHAKMDHSKMDAGMSHSKTKPTWAMPHPTNNKVYVAGNGINEVLEIDLEKWKITNRFATGKAPYNIDISPDGKLIVDTGTKVPSETKFNVS